MDYTIEFDKIYRSVNRDERIVIVNHLNCPAVFRMIQQHWTNGDDDVIIYEYFINEYYLSSEDGTSIGNVSLDILVEAWFDSNKDYCWEHE